jgi:archaemetzincin
MKSSNNKFFLILIGILLCNCGHSPKSPEIENSPPNDEKVAKILKQKDAIAPFFQPMKVQEGDWLKSFYEEGQTFEQYLVCNPTLPTKERQTIYIQPVGEFTKLQQKVMQLTADYMAAFYNLPVKLNETKALGSIDDNQKRKNKFDKQPQIKTGYFLNDLLPKMLPEDAAAFICFTNFDLYPDDNWNYVFGQATLQTRVGVWSLARLGKPENGVDEYKLFLARTLKIAMHETGHMFTIQHCAKYECLMSGTNHLGETDRRPLDVCPECMAKISWAMNYEPIERYENLSKFWREQGRAEISIEFLEKYRAIKKLEDEK